MHVTTLAIFITLKNDELLMSLRVICSSLFSLANETHLNMDNLLYNVDSEGSTLLHLAVDSGIVAVRTF